MNNKAVSTSIIVCSAVLFFACSFAYADGIAQCFGDRQLTPAEKTVIRGVVKTIRRSLPKPPDGWELISVTSPESALPSKVFNEPCPIWYAVQAEYANKGNAIDLAKTTDPEQLLRAAREMQDAMLKGDRKKVEGLDRQLSGTAMKAENATALITFRVNSVYSITNIGPADHVKHIAIEGAAYALYNDRPGNKQVGLYVGRWHPVTGSPISPYLMKGRPGDAVQVMEIVISGEIALDLARSLDAKLLASLVQ